MTLVSVNPAIPKSSPQRLKDILQVFPKEVFYKNPRKAWTAVFVNILMVGLGYGSIAIAPWFLLPFAWFFTGTALTGFFVIGHDCGHRSFAKRRWVNDLVGHTLMMPLLYPFHSWRIMHDLHHKYTNKMDVDNAWQPWRPEFYDSLPRAAQWGYSQFRGIFWWVASIIHWLGIHFDANQFQPKDRNKVKLSVAVALGFAAIAFPLLIGTLGIWGWVKFWLMPWLGYHFWMSTFTLVHHTIPEIQFSEPEDWNAAQAQLFGTVHCDYPPGVEFLCHHINVHIPHHLSTAIPSYNLRQAHRVLQQHWGGQLHEYRFSWKFLRRIIDRCHIYHPERAYQSCQEYDRSRK